MAIAATLLFGSLARADQSDGSDTDLLMINLDEDIRHVSVGRLSLFVYPWKQLKADAHTGNLFVCHLVREGKALLDPDGYLEKLQQAFEFRSTYADDIARAADLGWYLALFGDELNSTLLTKRALWCIRTILIARSADRRAPVFAPQRLAEETQSAPARELLIRRHHPLDGTTLRRSLWSFLEAEAPLSIDLNRADRATFLQRFTATANKVALQTLRQGEDSRAGYLE